MGNATCIQLQSVSYNRTLALRLPHCKLLNKPALDSIATIIRQLTREHVIRKLDFIAINNGDTFELESLFLRQLSKQETII